MAPKKSIYLVRVSSRARRIGSGVPSVRAWRPQEALLGAEGGFLSWEFLELQIALRGRKPALAGVRAGVSQFLGFNNAAGLCLLWL
jgi:hypothetical protein